jgi:hypothetical protein
MLWARMPSVLLPLQLRDLPDLIGRFLAHLLRQRVRVRPRQLDWLHAFALGAG